MVLFIIGEFRFFKESIVFQVYRGGIGIGLGRVFGVVIRDKGLVGLLVIFYWLMGQ